MSSGPAVVDATGRWGEGHASYPGRSVCLLMAAKPWARKVARRDEGQAEVSRGQSSRFAGGERTEHVEPNWHGAFDAPRRRSK